MVASAARTSIYKSPNSALLHVLVLILQKTGSSCCKTLNACNVIKDYVNLFVT